MNKPYFLQDNSKKLASRITSPFSIELPFQGPIYSQALQRLTSTLTSYPARYTFKLKNTYYDAKSNPCEHTIAFYQLARLFEALVLSIFNCSPLRRTYIPSYAIIDSKTLFQNIPGRQ